MDKADCPAGFAAWYRKDGQDGWTGPPHIHAIWAGCRLKPVLQQQVEDWLRGGNGLYSNSRYQFWQASAEMKDPRRDLPRALIVGVIAVALLYFSVNYVCVRALGVSTLANTPAPASAVMRMALGQRGATLIALGMAMAFIGHATSSGW